MFTDTIRDRFTVIQQYAQKGTVLDVGCIGARPKRELTSRRLEHKSNLLFRRIVEVNPNALGVDIDTEGTEILKKQGYRIECADAVNMELGRCFDTIVASEVVEHVENVGLFLRNLARHLNPQGVLILTTPNPFYVGQIWKIWHYGRPEVHEDHTGWFDPITLQHSLCCAGLETFDGYWVQPEHKLLKTWSRLFRSYFSHSFMILARSKTSETHRPPISACLL